MESPYKAIYGRINFKGIGQSPEKIYSAAYLRSNNLLSKYGIGLKINVRKKIKWTLQCLMSPEGNVLLAFSIF